MEINYPVTTTLPKRKWRHSEGKKSRPKIIRKESKKEKDTLGAGPADWQVTSIENF